jgi:SAM-dependent methyltransferase/predicted nucleotidyltransferase
MSDRPMETKEGQAATAILCAQLREWAVSRTDIGAVVLVGSAARGTMRPGSDVDVVVLADEVRFFLADRTWTSKFGAPLATSIETYGVLTSVRVAYESGLEVEFGIAPRAWASQPLDPGTIRVASDGLVVLFDRDGDATTLAAMLGQKDATESAATGLAHGLFAGKADAYRRHRTDYPAPVVAAALHAVAARTADVVADLGSGTGLLTRWLVERGHTVFAIEPEASMRRVAEEALREQHGDRFVSIAGTAERTTLPDASVHLVTAGNAFHYFDPALSRREVDRILRPGGSVLLVWHDLASAPNAFMRGYSAFLETSAPPALRTFHDNARSTESIGAFFGKLPLHDEDAGDHTFPLTWEALLGRFLSTSLAPSAVDPRRPQILAKLRDLFEHHQEGSTIQFQLRWRFRWARWPV